MQHGEELLLGQPASAMRRIHHLYKGSHAVPDDDEMGGTGRQASHDQGGQCFGDRQQQVIFGQQQLFGVQTQLLGHIFDRVDRGAIDIGLAGLAQAPIAGGDTEPLEQAFQGGWSAVHCRSLDDFRGQEALGGACCGGHCWAHR